MNYVCYLQYSVFSRNIETLILGKGPLNDTFFHSITDCRALKRLSISEAPLGNGVQEITIIHEKLIHLQVTRCRVLRISIR